MLSSLYPKSKSRTALRYFRIYCYLFFFIITVPQVPLVPEIAKIPQSADIQSIITPYCSCLLGFFFLFYVQGNCGRFISKYKTPTGFAFGMLRSPKTEFQGKPYGLHSLLSCSDKACFFFLFPSKVILIIHAFK